MSRAFWSQKSINNEAFPGKKGMYKLHNQFYNTKKGAVKTARREATDMEKILPVNTSSKDFPSRISENTDIRPHQYNAGGMRKPLRSWVVTNKHPLSEKMDEQVGIH